MHMISKELHAFVHAGLQRVGACCMFVPVTKLSWRPLYVCTCIQAFGEASACSVPMTKFLEKPLYILYLQYIYPSFQRATLCNIVFYVH